MIKLISCIIVVAGCSAAGIIKAFSFRARSREIENILELIRILEMEITYKKEPLHKTFNKVSLLKECWFSQLLKSCSLHLAQNDSLQTSWKNSISDNMSVCPLHKEDVLILEDMINGLGKSDTSGQKDVLESAAARLELALKKAKNQEEKQGRMYRGLGISAGIIIVIMFL